MVSSTVIVWVSLSLLISLLACAQQQAGDVVWHDGEDFTSAPKGLEQTIGEKAPASGGKALYGSALSKKGRQVTYAVKLPQDISDAKIIFRYARLHWRKTMTAAKMTCSLHSEGSQSEHQVKFDNTGGWGTDGSQEWGLSEVTVGPLKKGTLKLVITSNSDHSDINLDGFFVAPQGFAVSNEELQGLGRIKITSQGYLGIELTYSAIDQKSFPGFKVAGRGFVSHSQKITVGLQDQQGATAATFFKDESFSLLDKPTQFIIPPGSVQSVKDGSYTLRVSWDKGKSVLTMPFIVIGELMAAAEKKQAEISSFIAEIKSKKDNKIASYIDDLEYAVDYIQNGLVLLRSRSDLEQDPSSFKAALAYFEKSVKRTATSFAHDLTGFIKQTDETITRIKARQDPYDNRSGKAPVCHYRQTGALPDLYPSLVLAGRKNARAVNLARRRRRRERLSGYGRRGHTAYHGKTGLYHGVAQGHQLV
jgi:hypothetical protein